MAKRCGRRLGRGSRGEMQSPPRDLSWWRFRYDFYRRKPSFHRQLYALRIYRRGHECHDSPRSRNEPRAVGGCCHRPRSRAGRLFRCYSPIFGAHAIGPRLDAPCKLGSSSRFELELFPQSASRSLFAERFSGGCGEADSAAMIGFRPKRRGFCRANYLCIVLPCGRDSSGFSLQSLPRYQRRGMPIRLPLRLMKSRSTAISYFTIRNSPTPGLEGRVYIDDYLLSSSRALEKYAEKCN